MEGAREIFAVATTSSTPPKTRSTLCPYYLGRDELMKAINGQIGIRFKKCQSIDEAVHFSEGISQEEPVPDSVQRDSVQRDRCPLPGIKNTT